MEVGRKVGSFWIEVEGLVIIERRRIQVGWSGSKFEVRCAKKCYELERLISTIWFLCLLERMAIAHWVW